MTASQPRPDTALTLLFGPDEQVLDALTHAIVSAGADGNLDRAAGKLPQAVRDAASREVTAVTAGLLDINLIDLLIAGWCEYRDLTSAARRTLDAPGSAELVQLVTHRVSVWQRPYVSVLVDGHQVATVQLSLSVVFDVSAMLARVRAGRLVGVHVGSCDVTAMLAIDDMDVASKQTHLDLPGEISLRGELRLLPARDYPVAEYKATAVDDVRA